MTFATTWKIRGGEIDLTVPRIMGIVNVTPDSFSDGGLHATHESAVAWGKKLLGDGADILDVGGESTRPGAAAVSTEEELDRVIPVVRELAALGAVVSVDTSNPEVMRQSIEAGAAIINDIRAFAVEGAVEAVAHTGAGLVIMHMQGTPLTMQLSPSYGNVVEEVETFLLAREKMLLEAGVGANQICWDPGVGFGKTVEQNFSLIAATERFANHGRPYLMALSRKSSIGAVTGVENPAERVAGSVAGALLSVERGAQIVRVHDVSETREALAVWNAMRKAV